MNVQELRNSDHVETVKEDTTYSWSSGDNWRVVPNHESYNTQEGVKFLLSLNVKREYENGDLKVPKGNILE